jgi:hypothetical protein
MLLLMIANQGDSQPQAWSRTAASTLGAQNPASEALLAPYRYAYLNIGQNTPPSPTLAWSMSSAEAPAPTQLPSALTNQTR